MRCEFSPFWNEWAGPPQTNIGQLALGHIRKIHDKIKRDSGEGLPEVPASNFEKYLALQRGEKPQNSIQHASAKSFPEQSSALGLQSFPEIGDDSSDLENLPLPPPKSQMLEKPKAIVNILPKKRPLEEPESNKKMKLAASSDIVQALFKHQAWFQEQQLQQQKEFQSKIMSLLTKWNTKYHEFMIWRQIFY